MQQGNSRSSGKFLRRISFCAFIIGFAGAWGPENIKAVIAGMRQKIEAAGGISVVNGKNPACPSGTFVSSRYWGHEEGWRIAAPAVNRGWTKVKCLSCPIN